MNLNIPYNPPLTPDQQSANNMTAMEQLKAQNLAPSISQQVTRHLFLVHISELEDDFTIAY